jgi:hypothetical protein
VKYYSGAYRPHFSLFPCIRRNATVSPCEPHSRSFPPPTPASCYAIHTGTRHASSYGHPPELARRAAPAAPLQDVRFASPLVLPISSRSVLVAVLYILGFVLYTTFYLPYKYPKPEEAKFQIQGSGPRDLMCSLAHCHLTFGWFEGFINVLRICLVYIVSYPKSGCPQTQR